MTKLRNNAAVKIIKRHNRGSNPESKVGRRQNSESEIKKTVQLWIHEFKQKRHRIAATVGS